MDNIERIQNRRKQLGEATDAASHIITTLPLLLKRRSVLEGSENLMAHVCEFGKDKVPTDYTSQNYSDYKAQLSSCIDAARVIAEYIIPKQSRTATEVTVNQI